MADTCLFCRISDGSAPAEIVFRDELSVAFLDHRPLAHGHCLLIPRPHASTLLDLAPDLVGPLFERARSLLRAFETGLQADGSFLAVNTRISQSVPHLHVHVVPRWKKDGLFRGGYVWKRKPYESEEEKRRVADTIRLALGGN